MVNQQTSSSTDSQYFGYVDTRSNKLLNRPMVMHSTPSTVLSTWPTSMAMAVHAHGQPITITTTHTNPTTLNVSNHTAMLTTAAAGQSSLCTTNVANTRIDSGSGVPNTLPAMMYPPPSTSSAATNDCVGCRLDATSGSHTTTHHGTAAYTLTINGNNETSATTTTTTSSSTLHAFTLPPQSNTPWSTAMLHHVHATHPQSPPTLEGVASRLYTSPSQNTYSTSGLSSHRNVVACPPDCPERHHTGSASPGRSDCPALNGHSHTCHCTNTTPQHNGSNATHGMSVLFDWPNTLTGMNTRAVTSTAASSHLTTSSDEMSRPGLTSTAANVTSSLTSGIMSTSVSAPINNNNNNNVAHPTPSPPSSSTAGRLYMTPAAVMEQTPTLSPVSSVSSCDDVTALVFTPHSTQGAFSQPMTAPAPVQTFSNLNDLTHIALAQNKLASTDVFRCLWQNCTAVFPTADDILLHLLTLHQTDRTAAAATAPPRCRWSGCEDGAIKDANLESHLLQHLPGGTRLQCHWEGCSASFSDMVGLRDHVAEHIGKGQHEYFCRWVNCERGGRPFSQRQKALRHVQTHTGDKPFRCTICGKCFSEASILQQHHRTHTGEKPYKCTVEGCHREFSVAAALTIHLRTHTGEKPYKCRHPGCNKRFAESSNLTKHMRVHTGERPFACTETNCGKRFARPDQLARHRRTHTGERPFACTEPGCTRRFASKHALNCHQKRHTEAATTVTAATAAALLCTDMDTTSFNASSHAIVLPH